MPRSRRRAKRCAQPWRPAPGFLVMPAGWTFALPPLFGPGPLPRRGLRADSLNGRTRSDGIGPAPRPVPVPVDKSVEKLGTVDHNILWRTLLSVGSGRDSVKKFDKALFYHENNNLARLDRLYTAFPAEEIFPPRSVEPALEAQYIVFGGQNPIAGISPPTWKASISPRSSLEIGWTAPISTVRRDGSPCTVFEHSQTQ